MFSHYPSAFDNLCSMVNGYTDFDDEVYVQ